MHKKLIVLSIAAFAVLLASCANPAGSGGTPSSGAYVRGTITALGSIWVNGVEYQTGSATVKVDGDSATEASLKVGMEVEFNSTTDASGKPAATLVDYESSLKGSVDSIDTSKLQFSVLGQLVQTDSATVFDGTKDLTTLVVGNFVEVSGQSDPTAATPTIKASRVEVKTAEMLKVRGVVSGLDTAAQSFKLTTEDLKVYTVSYTGTLDPAVVNGSQVRVRFSLAPTGVGHDQISAVATDIKPRSSDVKRQDGDKAELEGVVADFQAGAGSGDPVSFKVRGQAVSARASLAAGVKNGAEVHVRGDLSNGVLVATWVKVQKPESELTLKEETGAISAIDLTAGSFSLGSHVYLVTVDTIFANPAWTGSNPLSKLSVGLTVEVKAFVDPADASLKAIKVERP